MRPTKVNENPRPGRERLKKRNRNLILLPNEFHIEHENMTISIIIVTVDYESIHVMLTMTSENRWSDRGPSMLEGGSLARKLLQFKHVSHATSSLAHVCNSFAGPSDQWI